MAASGALWVGTYTADSDGHGRGIEAVASAGDGWADGAETAVTTDSPSFVATHPTLPVVYAVGEQAQTLSAFAVIEPGVLEPLGTIWPAGPAACHVTVDAGGRFLVVACYGSGEVLSYGLDETGAIVSRQVAEPATDPHAGGLETDGRPANGAAAPADRTSRAHASLQLQDGRILTTDLGFDLLRAWRYEADRGLVLDSETPLPAGSGPRHLALHPSGHVYVVTEYSIEVVVFAADPSGAFQIVQTTPATVGGARNGDAAAHITVETAGRFVHVTIRGSNRVAVLAVLDGGSRLKPELDVDCGGNWPRHHLLAGDRLLVANQLSDQVTVFRIDESGVPVERLQSVAAGSPTCLIPQR